MSNEEHSLIHNLRVATCETPWRHLSGTDNRRRVCTKCKSQVFALKDLSQDEIESTLSPFVEASTNKLTVMRRFDGTLILQERPCEESLSQALKTGLMINLALMFVTLGVMLAINIVVGSVCGFMGVFLGHRKMIRIGIFEMALPAMIITAATTFVGALFVIVFGYFHW